MNRAAHEQTEFVTLDQEYKKYISELSTKWNRNNRVDSRDVYEVMRPEQQEEVHRRIAQWSYYITPLAEAWWKKLGYEVVWPNDNAKPMKVRKL